jgi:primosomal protein N'
MVMVSASMSFVSCANLSKGPTEFEQFSASFSQEIDKAGQSIEAYSVFVKELSGYEKRVGNLLNVDYDHIEETVSNIAHTKKEMDLQIQKAKDTGRSVTANGCYTDTGTEVRGWDSAAYTNMHIETKLSALDRASREAGKIYDSLDVNLLKRPNKPFNANATKLITQANIEVASAKSDIAAKDWASGKNAADRANDAIKHALILELNDVEQYQITLAQNELRKVSSDISLGSTLNKAGSIIEDAAKGATGILGGIGDILKGVGKKLSN